MKGNGLNTEESIRLEAYLLSEKAGHPPGMEHAFWVQAEAMVHGQVAALVPSTVERSGKTPAKAAVAKRQPASKTTKSAAAAARKKTMGDQLLLAPEPPATPKKRSVPAPRKSPRG